MTDRLATLMRGEVETLDIPAVPTSEILGAGRRLRRRRSWTRRGGVAVLAVAVIGAGAVALQGKDSTQATPATNPGPDKAYAADDTVYLGDGTTKAVMPEFAQSLYYTSAGLLVRTNKDGSSDGGAPFHFERVLADGSTTKLDVTLGEVVPSTDPTEPYLAWATMSDSKIQVVVHDISTDQDVATVDVPGAFDWGGWEAPPVALSGDLVYVGTNEKAEVVNWRTGEAQTSDVVPGSTMPEVAGGHTLVHEKGTARVVDAATGKSLLEIPTGNVDFPQLSPDGRFVIVRTGEGTPVGTHSDIYDIASGSKIQVPSTGWGWTASGNQVFRVHGSTMDTCGVTAGGQCQESTAAPVGKNAFVRYAGQTFES